MSVSAAICGFRVSARGHGDTKAPASVVTICLLLSTFGASHGGGKACRLLGSESTVSLTTFCEAEDVHKKGQVLCGRCSLARSPPLWPQGRATHLHSAARDTRRRSSAKRSFLQVRIRYKTVCLPKSAFRHRLHMCRFLDAGNNETLGALSEHAWHEVAGNVPRALWRLERGARPREA